MPIHFFFYPNLSERYNIHLGWSVRIFQFESIFECHFTYYIYVYQW